MTASIRTLSSSITRNSSMLIQKAAQFSPYFSPTRGGERFVPQIAELSLVGALGLAYLYQRGRALRDNDSSNDNRWLYALGEGVASQAVIQNIQMGLPALGIGWTAYEMGMAKGRMEKIKTALRGAVLFPLGYLGVLMGLGVTDGLRHRDASQVMQMLQHLEHDIAGSGKNSVLKQAATKLNPAMVQLKSRIQSLISLYNVSGPQLNKVPAATEAFLEAQRVFLEKCGKLPVAQLEALEKVGRPLLSRFRNASLYPAIRLLNPAFGYLLTVTFIGLPLVKLISDFALPKGQHRDVTTLGHNVAPLWFDRAIGQALPWGGAGGHGAEGDHSPYTSGNGPSVIAAMPGNSSHGGGH